jgi:hypothetical protein
LIWERDLYLFLHKPVLPELQAAASTKLDYSTTYVLNVN